MRKYYEKVVGSLKSAKDAMSEGGLLANIIIIFGFICLLASVLFGLWGWLWYGLVGGIVMVVEGVKLDPVSAWYIFGGIVRFVLATPIGWICGILAGFVSCCIMGIGVKMIEKD